LFVNNFYNFICMSEICFVFVLSITAKYDDVRFFGIYFERPFLSVFINYIQRLLQSSGELLITNRSSALTSGNLVIDYLTLRQAVMCSKILRQVIHKEK